MSRSAKDTGLKAEDEVKSTRGSSRTSSRATPKRKLMDDSTDDEATTSSDESVTESESDYEVPKRRAASKTPVKKTANKATPAKSPAKRMKKENDDEDGDDEDDEEQYEGIGADDSTTLNSPEGYATKEVAALVPTKGANKWWTNASAAKGKDATKWDTLDHNGVLFAPPYVPHGVKMKFKGQPVTLTPEQEEVATFFAAMIETDHAKKPEFRRNFFQSWQEFLGKKHTIQNFDDCDFSPIVEWVVNDREAKKEMRKSKEFKEATKKEKEALDSVYGKCLVDGFQEGVGNYKVEPPSLFRGRGGHPKTGRLKRRIMPEDVILNIGAGQAIPKCPIPGHNWKGIIHNPKVTWIAYYKDGITNSFKYVFLSSSSRFKGEADRAKYNKARILLQHIEEIRGNYESEMLNASEAVRQRATAMYLIDKLALRVGNEKDTSEEADTVGCCSLRVEHLNFNAPNKVEFDFLGKDSMRYHNEVEVPATVFKNLKSFAQGKGKTSDIFDKLTTTQLNDHLKSQMPGLTAKVFRTFNASVTLESELRDLVAKKKLPAVEDLPAVKELFYNDANRRVAIQCNHQRSVPQSHDAQLGNMNEKLQKIKDHLAALKSSKEQFDGKKLPSDKIKRADAAAKLEARIKTMESKIAMKDDNKTVALTTSKINYMDPRITVAWCKTLDLPIEKIFNKALLTKFPWAMEVPSTWRFSDIGKSEL